MRAHSVNMISTASPRCFGIVQVIRSVETFAKNWVLGQLSVRPLQLLLSNHTVSSRRKGMRKCQASHTGGCRGHKSVGTSSHETPHRNSFPPEHHDPNRCMHASDHDSEGSSWPSMPSMNFQCPPLLRRHSSSRWAPRDLGQSCYSCSSCPGQPFKYQHLTSNTA